MSTRLAAGQTWFVVLPGDGATSCVLVEEVTRKTVALRQEVDLGRGTRGRWLLGMCGRRCGGWRRFRETRKTL
jgi:hypothetical protein